MDLQKIESPLDSAKSLGSNVILQDKDTDFIKNMENGYRVQ